MDKAQVFVRIRSLNSHEKEKGETKIVKNTDDKVIGNYLVFLGIF
jgi:hypothetical protein